jgi:hypothetical protein
MSGSVWTFLASIPWFAWIPIAGIIGGTVSSVIQATYKHHERVEMIRQGMHPDGAKSTMPEV